MGEMLSGGFAADEEPSYEALSLLQEESGGGDVCSEYRLDMAAVDLEGHANALRVDDRGDVGSVQHPPRS